MKKLLFLISSLFVFNVNAQQPIEFVVSASPGGPNDTVTRLVADKITEKSNLKLVVVNKPGAAHVIGFNYVQNSDKPTLFMATTEVTKHEVYGQLEEVYNAGSFKNLLFVSSNLNISNFQQLIELSRKRDILFGHGGYNTFSHTAMEQVCSSVLKCLSVPYRSGSEGMLAVMSNQIDAYAITSYGIKQFLDNPKLVLVHEIKFGRDKSWFKLFAKNVSDKDKAVIQNVLRSTDHNFFKDMGFEIKP